MLETLSVHPCFCEQLRSGPLGRWVDDFVDILAERETRRARSAGMFEHPGRLETLLPPNR